jgi:small subunit ribosomal protein S6
VKRYEGFFLFDNSVAHEWPAVEQEVRRLCDRIGGELQVCLKFDERKLAFEIKGRKRGTYVLTYFDAAPERIVDLERDARLSEMILRALVLRADKVSAERIAELQAWPADTPLTPVSGDGRRHYDEPRGRREPSAKQQERPADARAEAAQAPSEAGAETVTPEVAAGEGIAATPPDDTPRAAEPAADLPATSHDAPSEHADDAEEET